MRRELKALLVASLAGLSVVGASYGVSALVAPHLAQHQTVNSSRDGGRDAATTSAVASSQLVATGHSLFSQACSSCHGTQGQGGFGPSLYNSDLTDAKIASTVTNGVKGRMPAFGSQYKAPQVQALTAYIRSLKM